MIRVPSSSRNGLVFGWEGAQAPSGQSLVSAQTLAPNSAVQRVDSAAGPGLLHTADNMGIDADALVVANYTGDVTALWRGVILGANTGYGSFVAVFYGPGSSNPYTLFDLNRSGAVSADHLTFSRNQAGNIRSADVNVGLSAYYGQPVVIAVSHQRDRISDLIIVPKNGPIAFHSPNIGWNIATDTSSTAGSDRILIGRRSGTANCVNSAAYIWNRGLPLGELVQVALAQWEQPNSSRILFRELSAGATTAPEITVTGNGVGITDGDTTPSATDHTDFGTTPQGTTKSRTFTITNDGDADLIISSVALSGTDAAEFTITGDPSGTIAPAGTASLIVRADAANVGTFVATVTVNSNDANEAAFNFDITVEVTEPAAADGDGVGGGLLQPKLSGFMLHPYHLKIRKRR